MRERTEEKLEVKKHSRRKDVKKGGTVEVARKEGV